MHIQFYDLVWNCWELWPDACLFLE
jgi:hypothetical protein